MEMELNTAEIKADKKDVPKKSIGGLIPEELYWQFTTARGARHESATEALENAVRLYVDIIK